MFGLWCERFSTWNALTASASKVQWRKKKNPQKIGFPLPLHKRALKGATPSILLCFPEAHHSQQIDHGVPLNKVKGPYPCWSLPESLTVTSMGGYHSFLLIEHLPLIPLIKPFHELAQSWHRDSQLYNQRNSQLSLISHLLFFFPSRIDSIGYNGQIEN